MNKYNMRQSPPFKTMLNELTSTMKAVLERFKKDGIIIANTKKVDNRWETCISCEWFKPSIRQCTKCGCALDIKIHLEVSTCPESKWKM